MDIEKLNRECIEVLNKLGWNNASIINKSGIGFFIAWSYFYHQGGHTNKNREYVADLIAKRDKRVKKWLLEVLKPVLTKYGIKEKDIL